MGVLNAPYSLGGHICCCVCAKDFQLLLFSRNVFGLGCSWLITGPQNILNVNLKLPPQLVHLLLRSVGLSVSSVLTQGVRKEMCMRLLEEEGTPAAILGTPAGPSHSGN